MNFKSKMITVFVLAALLVSAGLAQTKKTARPGTTMTVTEPSPTPDAAKKNGRPQNEPKHATQNRDYVPTYFYEFTRPGFTVSHILIEHDKTGKGKVSFQKQDINDMMTEPLQLTTVTVKTIDDALARLDFLTSTENYQFPRHDFSNMGNIVFRYVRDGSERTVKYNWTENPDAKVLMDVYRHIGTEAVWKSDLEIDRVNQPLDTPRLLDELDSYLQRDEISDPPHIIPLLIGITNDERLPLIARNHATRLITRIEKLQTKQK
jgi:hypothetical protein